MSSFLTISAVLAGSVLALEARRRFRRASGRLGRPRGSTPVPRGGAQNFDRQSLRGGGRKNQGRTSGRLAGPMVVGLVFVFMAAWLVLSYFAPNAETTAAEPAVAPIAPAPLQTTRALGGRLTAEGPAAATPEPGQQPPSTAWAAEAAKSMIKAPSRLEQVGQLLRTTKFRPAAPAKAPEANTPKSAPSPPPAAAAKPRLLAEVGADNAAKTPAAAPSSMVGAGSGAPAAGSSASAGRAPAILGGGRDFTVHLSSFRDRDNAEGYKNKLAAAGEKAFISETTVNGQHWYRVMSGRFKSREEAASYGRDLKRRDLTADSGQYMIKPIE